MFRRIALVVCCVVAAGWGLGLGPFVTPSAATAQEAGNPFGAPAAEAAPAGENPFGAPADEKKPDEKKPAAKKPAAKKPAAKKPARPANRHIAPTQGDDLQARAEAKIRQALTAPTQMEFVEMPLQDAVSYLKDYHGIEIQLDNRALEDAGVGSDTPMTRTLNGLPLNASLSLLLSENDLTYVIRDGVLLITTEDKARVLLELRVYNVHEAVGEGISSEDVVNLLATLSGACEAGACPMWRTGDAGQVAGEHLQIVPFQNLLVVRASQRDHEELASLFAKLKDKLDEE